MSEPFDELTIAEMELCVEGLKRLFARPETRYLIERAGAGLLTPDEAAQYAKVRELLAQMAEMRAWMAGVVEATETRRPMLERLIRRVRRFFGKGRA